MTSSRSKMPLGLHRVSSDGPHGAVKLQHGATGGRYGLIRRRVINKRHAEV